MATVTNQLASSALRGQAVLVTLNSTETLSKLPNVTVGQQCTNGSSSAVGFVCSIDPAGSTFKISPRNPDGNFASTTPVGYLASGETITLV